MAKNILRIVETTIPEYPKTLDKRLEQIRFMMADNKIHCMTVNSIANVRYLTNFSGSNALLFILNDAIHLVTDDRYEEQVKTEIYPLPNLTIHITRNPWHYVVENKVFKKGVDSLGFEAEVMPYSVAVDIRNIIRPLKFKPLPSEVEPFMRAKLPHEIEYIRQSCELAEAVFAEIIKKVKVGMSEKELANELVFTARSMGSESDPFVPMVLTGSRSALPHGAPSDKKIKKNDILLFDFGCKVNGFGSDITRTVCVGKPTKEQKQIYELVKKAQMEAINNIRPGIKGNILDNFARRVIADEGYAQNFQHSLGHGLGISPHEKPFLSFRLEDEIVPEDSIVAIEPGLYFVDKYGIRIEDNVLVTRTGPKMLTQSPDTLISI